MRSPCVTVREEAASSEPGTLRFHVAQFGAGSHVVAADHVAGGKIGAWFKAGLRMKLGEAGVTLPGWTMAP